MAPSASSERLDEAANGSAGGNSSSSGLHPSESAASIASSMGSSMAGGSSGPGRGPAAGSSGSWLGGTLRRTPASPSALLSGPVDHCWLQYKPHSRPDRAMLDHLVQPQPSGAQPSSCVAPGKQVLLPLWDFRGCCNFVCRHGASCLTRSASQACRPPATLLVLGPDPADKWRRLAAVNSGMLRRHFQASQGRAVEAPLGAQIVGVERRRRVKIELRWSWCSSVPCALQLVSCAIIARPAMTHSAAHLQPLLCRSSQKRCCSRCCPTCRPPCRRGRKQGSVQTPRVRGLLVALLVGWWHCWWGGFPRACMGLRGVWQCKPSNQCALSCPSCWSQNLPLAAAEATAQPPPLPQLDPAALLQQLAGRDAVLPDMLLVVREAQLLGCLAAAVCCLWNPPHWNNGSVLALHQRLGWVVPRGRATRHAALPEQARFLGRLVARF